MGQGSKRWVVGLDEDICEEGAEGVLIRVRLYVKLDLTLEVDSLELELTEVRSW